MQRLRSTRSNAVSHKLTPRKSNLQKDDEEERCTSFEECEKFKIPALSLDDTELDHWPNGLLALTHLTELSLNNNSIRDVPTTDVGPESLERVSLVGNALTHAPVGLLAMPALKHLCLGANLISDPTPVFKCTQLMHAGLGFNRIKTLEVGPWFGKHSIMSLDLSHNDLCDLHGTLATLATLPSLVMLSLRGNPLSLHLDYRNATVKTLPRLLLLDGFEVEAQRGPGAVTLGPRAMRSTPSAFPAGKRLSIKPKGKSAAGSSLDRILSSLGPQGDSRSPQMGVRLSCYKLRPVPDFASRAPRGAASCDLWVDVHNILEGPQSLLVTRRLTVPVPGATLPADAAGADGEGEAGEAHWEAVVPIGVTLRDVVRTGVRVRLWEQWREAPPPPEVPAPPPAATGKGAPVEVPEPEPLEPLPKETWDPRVLGDTRCAFVQLLDAGAGGALESVSTVHLKPYPRLFDDRGVRMALEDPRHNEEVLATINVKLELHLDPEDIVTRMEGLEEGEAEEEED